MICRTLRQIPGMTSNHINTAKTNVIMGSKVCRSGDRRMITDYIGNVKYRFHPVFLSGESVQTEVLYGTALEYAGEALEKRRFGMCIVVSERFSLRRKHRKVYGVEIVPQAIEDASIMLRSMRLQTRSFCRKAEEVLEYYTDYAKRHPESMRADVIVVDPTEKRM